MESVHIKLEKFPHLHIFLWDGVEYINDCYEEVCMSERVPDIAADIREEHLSWFLSLMRRWFEDRHLVPFAIKDDYSEAFQAFCVKEIDSILSQRHPNFPPRRFTRSVGILKAMRSNLDTSGDILSIKDLRDSGYDGKADEILCERKEALDDAINAITTLFGN